MDTRKTTAFSSSEHKFAEHVKSKRPLIDLTHQIHNYLHSNSNSNVIVWPEGFGKSMFLSMCAEYEDVLGDQTVFAGLAINTEFQYKKSIEHLRRKFTIYLDLADVSGKDYDDFLRNMYFYMRDLIRRTEDKMRRYLGKNDLEPVKIFHGSEYAATDEQIKITHQNDLRYSLEDLTRWVSQYFESDHINIYIDHFDAPATRAFLNGDLKLSKDVGNFVSSLIGFHKGSQVHHRTIMAGRFGLQNECGGAFSTHHNVLTYHHSHSANNICLGVNRRALRSYFKQQKIEFSEAKQAEQDMILAAGWYYTSRSRVLKPAKLFSPPDNVAANYGNAHDLIQQMFNHLNGGELKELIYMLNNPQYEYRFNLNIELWGTTGIDRKAVWMLSMLLATGYLTFSNKDSIEESGSVFSAATFEIPHPDLRQDLQNMIEARLAVLQQSEQRQRQQPGMFKAAPQPENNRASEKKCVLQ